MPTVHEKLASEARKATFLARLDTLASVDRMVGMADGFATDKTRKVADRVRGAVKLLIVDLNGRPGGLVVDLLG